mgnify:FL=1
MAEDLPHCGTCACNEDDVFLPKSELDEYPINREYYTPLDAVDIKKTSQSWIALLYCDSVKGYGKSFRLYMWRKPKTGGDWKPALCNFPADNNIAMPVNLQRMIKFVKKYKSE